MPVRKYRKKPLEIEAIQFLGSDNEENIQEIKAFAPGMFFVIDPEDRGDDPDIHAEIFDTLHSTWVGVKNGDYIIKGVKGEFYPHDGSLWPEVYDEVWA